MGTTIQPAKAEIGLSFVHRLFLALNLGFPAAVWTLVRLTSRQDPGQLGWLHGTVLTINRLFRHRPGDVYNPGWGVVLGAWTIALALLFLVLLSFLRHTTVGRVILDPIGGMVALGAIPTYWLLGERPPNVVLFSDSLRFGLLLELGLAFALIALTRKRPMPAPYIVTLLIYHYGLWTLVILDHIEQRRLAFELVPSLICPCAGIVWALYANRVRPTHSVPTPVVGQKAKGDIHDK